MPDFAEVERVVVGEDGDRSSKVKCDHIAHLDAGNIAASLDQSNRGDCTGSGSAVVLCVSLLRSHLDRDRRGRIEAAIALPLVGLVAVAIDALSLSATWIGAAAFVAGMFVSIRFRQFGPMGSRIASLISRPFVAFLVTPFIPTMREG